MKIKVIVSTIIFYVIILITGQVNAAIEVNVTGECKKEVMPGEKIEYNLILDVNAAEEGIEGIIAEIEYPTDILTMKNTSLNEVITVEGMLLVALNEPITSGQKRSIPLTFIVNDNTTEKEAIIKFKDIVLTDVSTSMREDFEDIVTVIEIIHEDEKTELDNEGSVIEDKDDLNNKQDLVEDKNDITNNGNLQENKNNLINTNSSIENNNDLSNTSKQENKKDETIVDKPYPYTGIERILIPIMILLIVVIVSYGKYARYKDI